MSNEPDIPSYDLQQSVTDTPLRSQQQQQRQRQQEQGEQQEQQQEPLDGESGRRRSSSDPVGRGRQRPGLAILRPRRGTNGSTLSQIPENARPMSTALFNSPKRRTEIDENLADILDVIGKPHISYSKHFQGQS